LNKVTACFKTIYHFNTPNFHYMKDFYLNGNCCYYTEKNTSYRIINYNPVYTIFNTFYTYFIYNTYCSYPTSNKYYENFYISDINSYKLFNCRDYYKIYSFI